MIQVSEFHWYVAMTGPNREKVAVDRLTERGVACLLPVQSFWRRKTRYDKQKQLAEYPLMPRYVLVGVGSPLELSEIWTFKNLIQGFVANDGRALRVPREQVERLVNRGSSYTPPKSHKFMKTHKEFSEGDEVMVVEGLLKDKIVRVEKIEGNRAHILLELFNAPHDVELRLDTLVAI